MEEKKLSVLFCFVLLLTAGNCPVLSYFSSRRIACYQEDSQEWMLFALTGFVTPEHTRCGWNLSEYRMSLGGRECLGNGKSLF